MDFWIEFWINSAIGTMLSTVKNPESKVKFRRAFLKVFKAMKAAYPNDPDFE